MVIEEKGMGSTPGTRGPGKGRTRHEIRDVIAYRWMEADNRLSASSQISSRD